MIIVNTVQSSTPTGAGKITAKAMGKQRTVRVDHSRTSEANHAVAVGALMAVIATPEQKAKVLHPSGGQRVRYEYVSDFGGKMRWSIHA